MGNNNQLTITRGTVPEAFFDAFDFRPSTAATYRRELAVFVDYLTENGITHPTPGDIRAYRDRMAAELKPTTLRTRMAAIKRFFTWTSQTTPMLYPNIAANIRPPRVTRDFKKDFLTLAEVVKLEDSIDTHGERGKRDRAIISLMITAGLRDVEITRAKFKHLERIGGEWWLKVWGKGHDDADRVNRITEPEILFDYINAKYHGTEPPAEDYIFTSVSNNTAAADVTPMNPGSISRIIKNRLRYIGIDSPTVTAHSLRHTAGAQAIEAGESLEDVSEMLGHSSTAITKTYTHGLQRKHNRAEYSLKAAIDKERERRKKN